MDKGERKRVSAAPGAWEAALRERLKGVELPVAEVTPVVPALVPRKRRERGILIAASMVAAVAGLLIALLVTPRTEEGVVPLPGDPVFREVPSSPVAQWGKEESGETNSPSVLHSHPARKRLQPIEPLRPTEVRLATNALPEIGRPAIYRPTREGKVGGQSSEGTLPETSHSAIYRPAKGGKVAGQSSRGTLPVVPRPAPATRLLASALIPGRSGISGGSPMALLTSTSRSEQEDAAVRLTRRPVLEVEAHLMHPIVGERVYADLGVSYSWQRLELAEQGVRGYYRQDMHAIGVGPGVAARLLRIGASEVSGYGAVGLSLPLRSETESDLLLVEGERERRMMVDLRAGLRLSASVGRGLRVYGSAGVSYDLVPPSVALPGAELPRLTPRLSLGISMDLPSLSGGA